MASEQHAGLTHDEAAIRSVMAAYNAALNGGDINAVMPLYAEDSVFMPPYSSSAVGIEAVRRAYEAVFAELSFDVQFDVVELIQIAPDWAYVRTNSAGTTAHAFSGRTTAEANQELFLLRKSGDGHWLISRYSFSPTKPPAKG